MNREKFPEKIPFRLTRMLTNAMEVICSYICEMANDAICCRLLGLKETSV